MDVSEYYCTAFAHLVFTGSSIWALYSVNRSSTWAVTTFCLHLAHAAIGVFRFGHPDHGYKARKLYSLISFLSIATSLPFLSIQLLQHCRYKSDISYLPITFIVTAVLARVATKEDRGLIKLTCACNVILIAYFSAIGENFYGVAMALSYTINNFLVGYLGRRFDHPTVDLVTYGLCFGNYFAVKALRDQY